MAAGEGARLGGPTPKQFLDLGGSPVLAWSVTAHAGHPEIDQVVVVLPADRVAARPEWLPMDVGAVEGGAARADSVRAGVAALRGDPEIVLVHDGARPFVSSALITRVIDAARHGPVVPALRVTDTIKRIDDRGVVVETVPREALRRAQTPQGFPARTLTRAHAADVEAGGQTDEAVLCERLGIGVSTIEGDPANLKITTAHDLALARSLVDAGLISPES